MATVYTRAAKGSALTWTEGDANITNLNNDKIEDIVEDITPQLGGDLDVNGNKIVSASNGNIDIQAHGTGIVRILNDGLVVGDGLTSAGISSNGSNDLSLLTNSGTTTGEIRITAGANGDITLTPNGTGAVVIDGNEFPQAIGAAGEVLTADGSGLVEWKLNQTISAQVYNADTVTINKGEPVYVFGAQGTNISVKLAVNTGDSTSAQTLGLAAENISAGATGIVICQGVLRNVDTSTYTAGQALYLGATAGAITTTKPKEPNHLVYLGFVETVNSTSGRIYVRVQNGYELDEIHDVNINNATALANNHLLRYNSTNTRWENAALDIVTDTTPQLGGDLDVNGFKIVSTSNGNVEIEPNGTGDVYLTADTVRLGDANTQANLTTNGTGGLNVTAGSFIAITPGGSGLLQLVGSNSGGSIIIGTGANANISLTPNGTGQTVVKNLEYNENIFSLGTTSGTITPDVANGNVQTITLNGNLTFSAFSNPVAGQSLTLIINTNGTSRTLTSTMKFAGGSKTLSTTNTTDIITVFYDGTNYWASLSVDFK